jgi:hypothetical protein
MAYGHRLRMRRLTLRVLQCTMFTLPMFLRRSKDTLSASSLCPTTRLKVSRPCCASWLLRTMPTAGKRHSSRWGSSWRTRLDAQPGSSSIRACCTPSRSWSSFAKSARSMACGCATSSTWTCRVGPQPSAKTRGPNAAGSNSETNLGSKEKKRLSNLDM